MEGDTMTAIATNTEVFTFMGTPPDVVTTQGAAITALITETQAKFEEVTGRIATTEAVTAGLFGDGQDAEIYNNKMYLKGKYRDIVSISALLEEGTALSVATGSTSNGYRLDTRLGIIERIGSNFLLSPLSYKITGVIGLNSINNIKQLIIELVAAKSGLWKSNVQTSDGTIEIVRTSISDDAKKEFNRYILRDA